MDKDVRELIKHKGCDLCIFECDKPTLLSVADKKFKGHKDCMRKIEQRLIKFATISRHTTRW